MYLKHVFFLIAIILTIILSLLCIKKLQKKKEMFVNKQDTILYFYANWCPHCTTFKPEVIQFKNRQANSNNPVDVRLLEESNCPPELMKKHNIRGFPTVIYTSKDKTIEFNGERNAVSLEAFLDQCRRS